MVCAPVWSIIPNRKGAQTMLYLTGTMLSTVDRAHYGVSRAKVWVSGLWYKAVCDACSLRFTCTMYIAVFLHLKT